MVYNSNPAAIAPDQNAVLRGIAARRSVHGGAGAVPERHRRLRRLSCCRRPRSWSTPTSTSPTATTTCSSRARRFPRPARPSPTSRSSGCWPRAWGSTTPASATREDDMIRTLLDSPHPFVRGITLEELERERFVRLRIPQPFLPFAAGGFGTPGGKCHFHAETLDYTPPVESRHGDPELRRKYPLELISPKNDDSMNSTFGHRDAVDLQTAALHLARRRCRAAGHPHLRPGARVQRPRLLRAAGARGRYRAAGRGVRALGALGEARAGKAQRERADLRAAHRRRRRPDVLQLPGSGGERMGKLKHAPPRDGRRLHRPRPGPTKRYTS